MAKKHTHDRDDEDILDIVPSHQTFRAMDKD